MHRLIAYVLFLHVIGMVASSRRRHEPRGFSAALWLVLAALVAHVAVAAVMVLQHLPMPLRVLHAALGALVWGMLVGLTWLAGGGAERRGVA
jgi:heme A synthase